MKRRASAASWLAAGGCALVLGTATPAMGEPTVPNTFSGGTPISAAQVNQNFQALAGVMPAANYLYNYNNGSVPSGAGGGAGTVVTLIGMTITPPADGAVLVNGGALLTITQSAAGNDSVLIGIDSDHGGESSNRLVLNTTGASAQTLNGAPAVTWTFPVTGGQATTFRVYARKWAGTNAASYTQPWMTVLFVPRLLPCTATVSAMSQYGCYP